MQSLTLAIDGMSCGHCLNAVRGALSRLPGVTVEQVTMGRARVSFDPGTASVQSIVDAVNDEGYTAHAVAA